jgi:hypothetical protein
MNTRVQCPSILRIDPEHEAPRQSLQRPLPTPVGIFHIGNASAFAREEKVLVLDETCRGHPCPQSEWRSMIAIARGHNTMRPGRELDLGRVLPFRFAVTNHWLCGTQHRFARSRSL